MADTNTSVYQFVLPEPGASDDTWGIKINNDLVKLDTLLASVFTPSPTDTNSLGNLKALAMPPLLVNQRLQNPYIEPTVADADGSVLMEFHFARAWRVLQKGLGNTANLEFQATVGGKSLYISNFDRTKGFHFDPDTGVFDVFGNTDLKVNSYLGTTARFTGNVYGQFIHSNGYFYIKEYTSDPNAGTPFLGAARASYDGPTRTLTWNADTGSTTASMIMRLSNSIIYGVGFADIGKVFINALPDGTLNDGYVSAADGNTLRLRSGGTVISLIAANGDLIGHAELAGSSSTNDGDTIMTRQKCDARYVRA